MARPLPQTIAKGSFALDQSKMQSYTVSSPIFERNVKCHEEVVHHQARDEHHASYPPRTGNPLSQNARYRIQTGQTNERPIEKDSPTDRAP